MSGRRWPAVPDLRGGVLVIDKRAGLTSHDVVHIVRRALGGARVGHTGTLDPFATGVLALVVGRATRLARFFAEADKEYFAQVRLGSATDTYDATGTVTFTRPAAVPLPDAAAVAAVLAGMEGEQAQVPPPFSAKKAGGVPAYERARRGDRVELPPVRVRAHRLEVERLEGDGLDLRVRCSAGYYVRALAHDLGAALGVGAHLAGLRRLRSGAYRIEESVDLELVLREPDRSLERLIPLEALLPEVPAITLTAEGERRVRHGLAVGPGHARQWADPPPRVRLLDPGGLLLAIAERQAGGLLHPGLVVG